MDSDDGELSDYLHFFQTYKFQENSSDKIVAAQAKRMQLLINTLESEKYEDRVATRVLLENGLDEYSQLIDHKDGINNYADYINALCNKVTHLNTECTKWKSGVETFEDINEIIEDLQLHKKTEAEAELDNRVLQNLTTKLNEYRTQNSINSSPEIDHKHTVNRESKKNSFNSNFDNICGSENVAVGRSSDLLNSKSSVLGVKNASNSVLLNHSTDRNSWFSNSSNISHQGKSNTDKLVSCSSNSQNDAKSVVWNQSKKNINQTSSFQPVKSIFMPKSLKSTRNGNQCIDTENQQRVIDSGAFRTARTELKIQNLKKYGSRDAEVHAPKESIGVKRSLGTRPRSVNSKFIRPIKNEDSIENESPNTSDELLIEDERLKNLDPKMIELIRNEIMDHGNLVTWDDISGLEFAKKTIQEIVVWPLLRPDIFTGLRRPPKGILLFGPPGTGKTLIGKCIASQSSSTFFSISASSLTSKWIGESEKLVRTLFAVARCYQPAVIFIDEIDSLLSQRSESEHESSRRIKTEFLVQLDGATTQEDDRILVIGATNRPQELDEAARRRLVKRLYIPLPEFEARRQIVERLMSTEKNDLAEDNINEIAKLTDGYSGADMKNLCQEASLGPIRSIDFRLIGSIESQEVRAVTLSDFHAALKVVRSSVSTADLNQYLEWDKTYGSRGN